jgi:proteic killer suppression protein
MIRTFNNKETEKIFNRFHSRRFPENVQRIAFRKLRMINRAISINDLRVPPANRLEKLKGNRAGQYSIRINDQWRICFEWQNGDAEKVEIADYHKG